MKKTLISMMGVAVVLSSAMAQENENKEKEQQVPSQKEDVVQYESYDEILEQQMQERQQAFNQDYLQKDEKALARFLERQRNRILEWEKQQSRTR
ncbi:MAG: hypothetical protein IJY92_04015 [Alphaproteobacteria bacterium]|nr:hypothetical protein [Alphaproteobacteria bacterium]